MKISTKIPDWVIGLAITILFCLALFLKIGFLEAIEFKSYDFRMKLFPPETRVNEIAIVAVDDESISKLGRWPWPRTRMAEAIEWLSMAGAKVIGVNILFSEPEESSGLVAIDAVSKRFTELGLLEAKGGQDFLNEINALKVSLNRDEQLSNIVTASQRVVFPVFFNFPQGRQITGNKPKAPDYISKASLSINGNDNIPSAMEMIWPLENIGSGAMDLGHVNRFPDSDGVTRWDATLVSYGGKVYESYPLAIAARFLDLKKGDINITQEGLMMGSHAIPTDASMRMLVNYYGPPGTFNYYSFYDVVNNKVDPSAFSDKIVLVGMTALGLGIAEASPVSPVLPSIEKVATVINNLLNQNFIKKPVWADNFAFGITLLFGLIAAFLLPRLSAGMGAILSLTLLISYTVGVIVAYVYGMWLNLTFPILVLVSSYVAVISRRYLAVEKQKNAAEEESDEANKLLGLTFQGKGMLDLAFEKFKVIPVTDEIKDLLYNLALDYERKRMASKAVMVYERIASSDKNFKDIGERIQKLNSAATTGIWQGQKSSAGGTAIIEGMEKPTIGRYEIIQELGRGAMGIVYKGVDPKINREVAIKTVYFDEVDPDTLQSIKERFFREAMSAGKMTHQNIVTIYDAGEEADLAYIAMEFIKGKTLEGACKKNALLPPSAVLKIVGQVAEGLDYAHANGIVHRDIKPANIMLLPNGIAKVTDFGIARVQSSSHTKTGVVMGTPSYMSPEQVAGKKVDGRSDLFSLGVMLFELLTGEKPFKGDSMATVMFQITTTNPPELNSIRPELHPILQSFITKALAKNPDERFQTGKEFANGIRVCMGKMGQENTNVNIKKETP